VAGDTPRSSRRRELVTEKANRRHRSRRSVGNGETDQ
jgi:hypothetical protein